MKKFLSKLLNVTSIFVLVIGLLAGLGLVQDVVNFRGKASGTPANLVVDLSTSFSDQKNAWEFLAQGGEERGRSLAPVIELTRALAPRYIRIDHIYDFFNVVSRDTSGKLVYNWTELDAYIRDIQAMGAKPFLALSYTPAVLGVKDTDAPDLASWTALTQATIDHISGNSGLAIADVYYEVWNEPDLFGQFKVYPPKNYIDLYRASSLGASAVGNVQPFKFGGPATTALYQNWFDALAKLAKEENARFDFFSWHQYGNDVNDLEQRIADATSWKATAELPNLELFVTEHGIDGANNSDYDTDKGAIHSLAASLVAADKLQGMFHFEIKDGPGPKQLWGRWGLITNEKYGVTKKPRYNALAFLLPMTRGERVNIAGNGSWVKAIARMDEKSARLFLVNYDPDDKHVEAVPIKFTGVPFAKFNFVRRDFDGKTREVPVTPTNGQYQTVEYMRANSAAIFELIPQK